MWRPNPSVRPSVTELKCLLDFREVWSRFFKRKLSGKREFRENRRSNIYTLLKGVNEFLPVKSIILDRLKPNSARKFST
jgi:hypothetical protein